MHENHEKQLRGVQKGKITKKRTPSKTSGYNAFVKEAFSDIARISQLSNTEIMKEVGRRWKSLTKEEKMLTK